MIGRPFKTTFNAFIAAYLRNGVLPHLAEVLPTNDDTNLDSLDPAELGTTPEFTPPDISTGILAKTRRHV